MCIIQYMCSQIRPSSIAVASEEISLSLLLAASSRHVCLHVRKGVHYLCRPAVWHITAIGLGVYPCGISSAWSKQALDEPVDQQETAQSPWSHTVPHAFGVPRSMTTHSHDLACAIKQTKTKWITSWCAHYMRSHVETCSLKYIWLCMCVSSELICTRISSSSYSSFSPPADIPENTWHVARCGGGGCSLHARAEEPTPLRILWNWCHRWCKRRVLAHWNQSSSRVGKL